MNKTKTNILILGGNGFIGQNLTKTLSLCEDFNLSVFDLRTPSIKYQGVKYYEGSIEDSSKIFEIIDKDNINVLIHLVSTIVPGATIEQYINNCRLVQLSTIPIIDYCASHKIKFVFCSSGGTVYGIKGGVISEYENSAPISYYGLSKVQIEELVNFYHRRYNLEFLVLRPSNPYGPGQNIHGKQGLIAVMLGKVLANEPIKIFGDGNVIRDYIYIDDLSHYIKELILKDIKNETINIGSGIGYSVKQIYDTVQQIVGGNISCEYLPGRLDDVPKIILDTTRLHNYVKHVDVSIHEGIARFYNYLKVN